MLHTLRASQGSPAESCSTSRMRTATGAATLRDLEGHIWNFGTYDPWKRQPASPTQATPWRGGGLRRLACRGGIDRCRPRFAGGGRMGPGRTDVSQFELGGVASANVAERAGSPPRDQLARERDAREAAERARQGCQGTARQGAGRAGGRRAASAQHARAAGAGAHRERTAERVTKEIQAQLVREQSARENAERTVNGPAIRRPERTPSGRSRTRGQRLSLAERASDGRAGAAGAERSARSAAELSAQQVREQLAKERGPKDAAERAAKEAREEANERAAKKPSPPPRQRPAAIIAAGSKQQGDLELGALKSRSAAYSASPAILVAAASTFCARPWQVSSARQHPASARDGVPPQAVLLGRCGTWATAHARLGQYQLDPLCCLPVAGNVSDDGANLLVAGHHQGKSAPFQGLHCRRDTSLARLRQLARSVRSHRAAAVQVGVDQRRERRRAFERGVQGHAQLAQKRIVGPQPGGDRKLVGQDALATAA